MEELVNGNIFSSLASNADNYFRAKKLCIIFFYMSSVAGNFFLTLFDYLPTWVG